LGQSYLPNDIKQLFHWCKYYFMTNPVVNAAISKMAEYPVTPLMFKTNDSVQRGKYEELAKILHLKSMRIEIGIDYFTYGNAFLSIMFPFKKHLACASCGFEAPIKNTKYRWVSMKYNITCKSCGQSGFAKVRDVYVRSVRDIRLMRWNPENIDIIYSELSGKKTIIYNMPIGVSNDIIQGKADAIEELPDVFIEAVREKKKVYFHPDNVFHFRRPTLSQKIPGWGAPILLPVLKDLHYMGVLRRAQEAVAQEHIVPLRLVYPAAAGATSDPFSNINLSDWKAEVEEQLVQWKRDPNRIPVMPLPLGIQNIGGDGRALILHQEYRVWAEHIAAGMGVPPEFIFGGIQYSSTNLTMFQLHNKILGYCEEQKEVVFDFIYGRICSYMGWPRPDGDFKPFKMADDLQRTMLYFQLNQAQKISDATLLEDIGMDVAVERDRMEAERSRTIALQSKMQKEQAHIQGEVSAIQNKYQLEVQKSQMVMQAEVQMQQQMQQMQMQQQMQQQGMAPEQQMGQEGQEAPQEEAQAEQAPQEEAPGGAMSGEEVAPGFPEEATAYPNNAEASPQTGVDSIIGNPEEMTPSGMSMNYVAKRAANFLSSLSPEERANRLAIMQSQNPRLAGLVNQILQSAKGSQANTFNPLQMPLPEQRPQRREQVIGPG
jgi:ribosomal protein L37E